MPSADGAWLRSQRQARGWAAWEMSRRIAAAAGDERRTLPDHETLMRYVRRWEAGKCRMTERYQLLCRKAFGLDDYGPAGDGAWPGRRSVLTGGLLAGALLAVGPEALDVLAWAERHPPRIDASAVDALAGLLAAQRHADDVLGSAAMLGPAAAQLTAVENLVTQARGPVRPALLNVGQQWQQFAGWLCRNTADDSGAGMRIGRALEWATEIGDRTMIATAMADKSEVALYAGQAGAAAGLAQAAQRDTRVAAGQRANAALFEARGHALAGDAAAAERKIGEAADLAAAAADGRQQRPWLYWMTPAYFGDQVGITSAYLAADPRWHARVTAQLQRADETAGFWAPAQNLTFLALAHTRAGEVDRACAAAARAAEAVKLAGSARWALMLDQIHADLQARWPGDPRVAGLAEALR